MDKRVKNILNDFENIGNQIKSVDENEKMTDEEKIKRLNELDGRLDDLKTNLDVIPDSAFFSPADRKSLDNGILKTKKIIGIKILKIKIRKKIKDIIKKIIMGKFFGRKQLDTVSKLINNLGNELQNATKFTEKTNTQLAQAGKNVPSMNAPVAEAPAL